jgi:hypothetical protein
MANLTVTIVVRTKQGGKRSWVIGCQCWLLYFHQVVFQRTT